MFTKPLLDVFRNKGSIGYGGTSYDLTKLGSPNAQIFIMSPELALAAETLVLDKKFQFPEITKLHFPYPEMVIEIPLTPAIRKLRSDIVSGTHQISRVAAYIQSDHTSNILACTVFWEFETFATFQPPYFTFYLGAAAAGFPTVRLGLSGNRSSTVDFSVIPSAVMLDALDRYKVSSEQLTQFYKESRIIIQEAMSELGSLLFASNLIINCKSGVTKTRVAAKMPQAGKKYGAHKRKQLTTSSYTVIHLDEAETVTSDGVITKRDDMAAHFVRGHFKQRSGGLYWWNSFIRGKGEVQHRTAYLVEATHETC